jgi:hypothetical protein
MTLKIGASKIGGLVLTCTLAAPAAAFAQLTAPVERAQIELGPVSIYPSVQLVEAGYDDNVFNESVDPKGDYTFTLASRILVVTKIAQNELMFSSGADYVWFKEYVSERSNNLKHAVRFNLSVSRWKPYVGASRTETQSRPNSEIDTRAKRLEHSAVVGSNFNLTARTAITASAQADDSAYDDGETFQGVELDYALDRRGQLYSGGVRYALTPLTTLHVTGNYQEDVFPQSHTRDATRVSVTPDLEFSPDAAIRGRFSAGYELFKPKDPSLPEHPGIVLDGSVNWATASLTGFDLQVGRNVSYSYQETEPYYISTSVRLAVSQRVFWDAELVANGSRELLSYHWHTGITPPPGAPVRRDTADTYGLGVGIPLHRGLKFVVGMEWQRRESEEHPETGYNRRRLISTFTIGY